MQKEARRIRTDRYIEGGSPFSAGNTRWGSIREKQKL
jgi:hypothetical protein